MLKRYSGLLLVFVIVTAIVFVLKEPLAGWKVDYRVLLGANIILFLLGLVSLSLHQRALGKPNPQVFIRSIMLANIIRLLSLAAAAFIYISVAGKTTSVNAVFGAMFLYIVYTWVEKRATIQLSKSRSEK